MNVSFAGCGFLGIYHVGVVSCLKEYAPNVVNKLSGASAGAIAACSLICGCELGLMTSEVLRLATTARAHRLGPFNPQFDLTGILRDRLTTVLPEDAHIRCTNRLHISVTRLYDHQNVIISQFSNKEELIQALLCSSFIPIFSGIFPPTYRGVRYVDGCYSNNLPVLDENTITVSPFCGECDICPRDNNYNLLQVNLANTSIEISPQNLLRFMRVLYPPPPELLSKMCKQGFDDALQFLQRNNMIACTRCIALHSTLKLQETKVSIPSSDSDEEVIDEDSDRLDCKGCSQRKAVALLEDLPEAVLIVLEEACASMNKGLINWIFKRKSMRILSVFTLPYVLPIDIAYVICVKLIQLLPKLKQDAIALVEKLIAQLKNIINNFNKQRHMYSAQYTCQLALTEYDFAVENDGFSRRMLRQSSSPCNQKGLQPLDADVLRHTSSERFLGKVNADFTVDMDAASKADAAGHLNFALSADAKERTAVGIASAAFHWESQKPRDWDTHVDSFEQILEVTRKQDALISYYYLNGKNEIKVTEIFNVTDADTSALLPVDELETNQNLCWDEDWQMIVNEPSDAWLPPTPVSDTKIQTHRDSVLDCSFDRISMSSDDTHDDSFSLLDLHIDPSERRGSFAFLDQ